MAIEHSTDHPAHGALAEQDEMLKKARRDWAEASRNDSEFGGDAFATNIKTAIKALDAFGTDELKALLNESGLGNHPEIIRAFYRVGRAMEAQGLAAEPVASTARTVH